MNVPEGFKQTEVGVIPEDWEVAELCQLADFLDGQRKPIKSSDREKMKGIYPYYGASGIIDYVNNYIFDDEMILLGEDGENILSRNLRLAFIVRGKVWVNNHAHVLKAKECCSTEFLAEKLESLNYEQYNSGTAQPKITKGTCAKIKISLPPTRAEQTAIAAALSDMDALIEGVEKLLEKKRRIKQGAMQELLTAKTRLPGFKGKWEVRRLGNVCRITTGKKDVNEGNPNGQFPFFTCSRYHTFSDSYSFDTEAILVAGNGEVGNLHYINGKFEAYQRTYVLSDFTAQVSYLWQQLTAYLADSLGLGKIGSSIPYIKKENLNDFEFKSPHNSAEQTAIAVILSDMDREIEQLETQLTKYRQLKTGMMQELLTGKKRLV